VTVYFSRTVAELDSAGEKLDDRMQPLLDSQCGAVVKSTDRNYIAASLFVVFVFCLNLFSVSFSICIGSSFI
jgi:hypothetical protein